MNKAAILVLVVSTGSCNVKNSVDKAESHRVPMTSMTECQRVADVVDPKPGITAYCEQKGKTDDG